MSKKIIYILLCTLSVLLFAAAILYFSIGRDLVALAYYGKAPQWFSDIISHLYPRFFIEKKRFSLEFFQSKADQVLIRLIFTGIVFITGCVLYLRNVWFKSHWSGFWSGKTSVINASTLRVLYFLFLLLIFHDFYNGLMTLSNASVFYKPIPLFRALDIGFPDHLIISIVCSLFLISCIAAIFNILPMIASSIAVIISIYFQGIIFGFEKTDHGFATMTYAGLIMPFLIVENRKASANNQTIQQGWPLRLISVLIVAGYLFSGLEKLFISGFDWLNSETFRSYLILHNAPLGVKVAQIEPLCMALPILTLLFQLGFISVFFSKKMKYVFLPAGILFHLSVYLLFGVGGFFHPWILAYIFFIDWTNTVNLIKLHLLKSKI